MVYSPPSNQHKPFPQPAAKPRVVTDEIDAGAIKLQPPKIRPISRSSTPKRRGPSADSWKRPAIHAVSTEQNTLVDIPSEFRAAATASTVELLTNSAVPITAPTVENLTHKIEVIRSTATTELHTTACEAVRQAVEETTAVSPITQWETPYNKPAIDTPENIQYTRLALQYLQQGRIEDAERLYKQALVVAERTFPVGSPAISRAVEDLATFYYGHEKFKQAEPFVSRLLKQRVESLACDDWLLIRTVDQLADVYEKSGEPIQAQALYKLLLARQEESFGHKSPVCAFTLSRLADSYLKQEHFSAAESLLHTILSIQETLHGRCSIEISTTLQELASIYQKLGRYDRAAEMLERLLHVLETIHGDNGLSVASCLLKLADLLNEIDMVAEAEPLYRRAQDIYQLSYGERTAAHSMFKKKLERVTETMINPSKLSKDKPADQEECSRFPAMRVSLDDMLPSKLGTGQVSRCLGHAISSEARSEKVVSLSEQRAIRVESSVNADRIEDTDNDSDSIDYDFSAASELIALDFSATVEMFAPSFDFTPSFNVNESIFETSDRSVDGIKSKFDSNGELDSILDPFFAKELAEIYESTTSGTEVSSADVDCVESVDQQDTILDLEPAKTLSLPTNATRRLNAPAQNSKIISEKTTKPSRLADKTAVLPLQSEPKLSTQVPGLVTVTATDIRTESQDLPRTAAQLRDTVREKPILLPEPFPSSRRKSATQTIFAVPHPGTKTRN